MLSVFATNAHPIGTTSKSSRHVSIIEYFNNKINIDSRIEKVELLESIHLWCIWIKLIIKSRTHIFKASIISVQSLQKLWEELITQIKYTVYSKHTKSLNLHFSKNVQSFPKQPNAHLLCNNCAKFADVSLDVQEEFITQSRYRLFKICWKN
jgi:hypothetical protein